MIGDDVDAARADRARVSRTSATAAPIRRRASCASATASRASCAPSATCCATSSLFMLRCGFDAFELKRRRTRSTRWREAINEFSVVLPADRRRTACRRWARQRARAGGVTFAEDSDRVAPHRDAAATTGATPAGRAAQRALRRRGRARPCCARCSRRSSPAVSRWSPRSARSRRCCCTWSRRSTPATPVMFLNTGKLFGETLRLPR